MLNKINELRTQKGSMMVEALAMLGLISMVTPVIYKKAAERTTEMQDINAANQVRVIVNSIDDYLRDNYGTITGGGKVTSQSAPDSAKDVDYSNFVSDGGTTQSTDPINIEHFRDYLPLGFRPDSKLFKEFDVVIKQTKDPSGGRKSLATVLVAKTSKDGKVDSSFTRMRSARIASMIGTNGGFVDGDKVTGVQGVWEIPTSELPNAVDSGTIVATSIESVAEGTSSGGKNVLYRVEVPGHPEYNAMETALNMGKNDINHLVNLIAADGQVNIKGKNDSNVTLNVAGNSIIDGVLKAADTNFIAAANHLWHSGNFYLGGGSSHDAHTFEVLGGTGAVRAANGNFELDGNGNTEQEGNARIGGNAWINGYALIREDLFALDGEFNAVKTGGISQFDFAPDGIIAIRSNKNYTGFMEGNVGFDRSGNTKISGVLSAKNDVHIGDDITTIGAGLGEGYNYESGGKINMYASSGDVDMAGHLTVGNGASINGDFFAGKMTDADNKYGLNVYADTGYTTIKSDFDVEVNDTRLFDVNKTTSEYVTASKFQAGNTNGDEKFVFKTDNKTATIQLKNDTDPGFAIINSEGKDQLKIQEDQFVFSAKDSPIFKLYRGRPFTTSDPIGGEIGGDDDPINRPFNPVGGDFTISPSQSLSAVSQANFAQMAGGGVEIIGGETNSPVDLEDQSVNMNAPVAKFSADLIVADDSSNILTVKGWNSEEKTGSVNIRKGIIEIARNESAEKPTSYIKADRMLANQVGDKLMDGTRNKDSNGSFTSEVAHPYEEFQVNPAYTSMMHDIKLSTRGGARLSDILPDFINKGIYVMDNTYKGDSNWEEKGLEWNDTEWILEGLEECTGTRCDTSAWMGFIPTPNCPPGYMQVATIAPIRFAMAQAGVPVHINANSIEGYNVSSDNYRVLGTRKNPLGDNVSVKEGGGKYRQTGETVVHIADIPLNSNNNIKIGEDEIGTSTNPLTYWAQVFNQPYTFQVSTWLNTTLKAYRIKPGDDTTFKGWHGVMGFIYPAMDYQEYLAATNQTPSNMSDTTIIWNLFPVYKQELSAIATVYCYFNRKAFDSRYVSPYLPHNMNGLDKIRYKSKGDVASKRLNDPKLSYDNVW